MPYITESYYQHKAATDRLNALMQAGFKVTSYTLNHVYYVRFQTVVGKQLP